MRKWFARILIAAFAASLLACGGTNDSEKDASVPAADTAEAGDIRSHFEKASAYVESLIDTTGMEVLTDEEDSEFLCRTWMYEKFISLPEIGREVTVDGKTIVIGETKVRDLPELGFEVAKFADELGPYEATSVSLQKGRKTFILSPQTNDTDRTLPLDDLPIFSFSATYSEDVIPFSYYGTDERTTLEDLIARWGIPNSSIRVTADSYGTYIELSYQSETADQDWITSDALTFSLNYRPEAGIACLFTVGLDHYYYQIGEGVCMDEPEPEV